MKWISYSAVSFTHTFLKGEQYVEVYKVTDGDGDIGKNGNGRKLLEKKLRSFEFIESFNVSTALSCVNFGMEEPKLYVIFKTLYPQ